MKTNTSTIPLPRNKSKVAHVALVFLLAGTFSAQAATVIGLTALNNTTTASHGLSNSSPALVGSHAAVLNDTFAYNPLSPTVPLPVLVWSSGAGYHGGVAGSGDVILNYELMAASFTTTVTDSVVVFDFYGRDSFQNRDNNFDVSIYNGTNHVASLTGLAIPDTATPYVRATFSGLSVGTQFDSVRVIGHDSEASDGNNYFTLMEMRAAAIPEPTVALLGGLGVLSLLRRRRN